jgi:4-amino-4-deoxy-L-arabinose transferase-like glycosyltransferase
MSIRKRLLSSEMAALMAILLLAAVFRYWQIDRYPQALHFDEAINGLIVRDLLRGIPPGLLSFNDAREPIVFYLMAASVAVWGPTPGALRVAMASVSLAVVGGVFLLARSLFGPKIGLLSALICAITVWPIYHGRLATRSILVPLALAAALSAGVQAWRTDRTRFWTLTGLLFGAVFYTYATNLFVIPALAATLAGLFTAARPALARRAKGIVLALVVGLAVGLPIFVARAQNPSTRPGELAMFYAGQSAADVVRTAASQAFLVARMFFIKGDLQIRHNLPGRPVFDALMAVPFVVGLVAAWRVRSWRGPAALCGAWLLVWLCPTFLTKDAPHFLRSSGALAFLFLCPALGLVWMQRRFQARLGKWVAVFAGAALLGGSAVLTTRDYVLSGFLGSPEVRQAFFGEHSVPILEFNRQHHTGWVGDNLIALPPPAGPATAETLERAQRLPQPYAQYLIPWAFDPDLRQY